MTTKAEYEDLIQRQSACIKSQMDRIGELEAEVARLNAVIQGDCDALQTLQKIYGDPSNPLSAVLKAAGIAVGFERPRPPSVDLHLIGIAERLGQARKAYLARMKVEQSVGDDPLGTDLTAVVRVICLN
jgi:hypothetical protein